MTALMNELLKAQSEFLEKRNLKLQQHSDKTAAAIQEAQEEAKRKAAEALKAQEEADRLAGILEGTDVLAPVYVAGDVIIPAAAIIESAWKRSALTVTGFNKIIKVKRDEVILAELDLLAEKYGAPLVAQMITPVEEPPKLIVEGSISADKIVISGPTTLQKWHEGGEMAKIEGGKIATDVLISGSVTVAADTLIGSSVLASTYEIAGETVQLGDLVAAAHKLFGGTVAEWNALTFDAREDLIRAELDRRLAAEADAFIDEDDKDEAGE